jgi:uncharacterized protein
MENLILFVLLALMAEILGTIGGFGSSIFFVPVAGLFLDFHSVLGVTALFHLFSNISKIALFRKGVNWKLILQLGIPAVVFVTAGAFMSKNISSSVLQTALSVFLILISSLMLVNDRLALRPSVTNTIAGGALSGFAAGLVGTGGAIRGLTLASFNLEKNVFITTSAVIDLGIDFSRSLVYFNNGYMHWHDLYLVLILLFVSFIGTLIGKRIIQRFSPERFKKIVLCFILLTGVYTLVNLWW